MSKSTLGRGLGDLLGSNRTESSPSAPMKPPGIGLRILIDGGPPPASESIASPAETPVPAPAATPFAPTRSVTVAPAKETDAELLTRLLAVVALIGADVALLAWAAHHVFFRSRTLSLMEIIACIATVLLAALCGCAAARLAATRA